MLIVLQSISVTALSVIGIVKLPWTKKLLLAIPFALLYVWSARALYDEHIKETRWLCHRIDNVYKQLSEIVMHSPHEAYVTSPPAQPSPHIRITTPIEGQNVSWRDIVKGTLDDPHSTVWVVVHPVGLSAYWVQPPPSVSKDGTWKTQVYFGRAGNIDIGKQFEIMAVVNPKEKMGEGYIFNTWPEAEARSKVVTVIRK